MKRNCSKAKNFSVRISSISCVWSSDPVSWICNSYTTDRCILPRYMYAHNTTHSIRYMKDEECKPENTYVLFSKP